MKTATNAQTFWLSTTDTCTTCDGHCRVQFVDDSDPCGLVSGDCPKCLGSGVEDVDLSFDNVVDYVAACVKRGETPDLSDEDRAALSASQRLPGMAPAKAVDRLNDLVRASAEGVAS